MKTLTHMKIGGGTAAGVLCQAGLDVVVLEKGGYYTEADFAKFGELEGDKVSRVVGPKWCWSVG